MASTLSIASQLTPRQDRMAGFLPSDTFEGLRKILRYLHSKPQRPFLGLSLSHQVGVPHTITSCFRVVQTADK
jgi:hypothetical protein